MNKLINYLKSRIPESFKDKQPKSILRVDTNAGLTESEQMQGSKTPEDIKKEQAEQIEKIKQLRLQLWEDKKIANIKQYGNLKQNLGVNNDNLFTGVIEQAMTSGNYEISYLVNDFTFLISKLVPDINSPTGFIYSRYVMCEGCIKFLEGYGVTPELAFQELLNKAYNY